MQLHVRPILEIKVRPQQSTSSGVGVSEPEPENAEHSPNSDPCHGDVREASDLQLSVTCLSFVFGLTKFGI